MPLGGLHRKAQAAAQRNHVASLELLTFGQDTIGAWAIQIAEPTIEPVVAVETAAAIPHLHQPWPDTFRWRLDRDRKVRFICRRSHQGIATHHTSPLRKGASPA